MIIRHERYLSEFIYYLKHITWLLFGRWEFDLTLCVVLGAICTNVFLQRKDFCFATDVSLKTLVKVVMLAATTLSMLLAGTTCAGMLPREGEAISQRT